MTGKREKNIFYEVHWVYFQKKLMICIWRFVCLCFIQATTSRCISGHTDHCSKVHTHTHTQTHTHTHTHTHTGTV